MEFNRLEPQNRNPLALDMGWKRLLNKPHHEKNHVLQSACAGYGLKELYGGDSLYLPKESQSACAGYGVEESTCWSVYSSGQ